MLDCVQDGTILVVPSGIKNEIIKEVRGNFSLREIKFMDINEFQRQFYFTYDNKTIYYLMNKYKWKYEVCLVYLKNLYYIEDKKYRYEKLNFLRELKKELDDNGLLIYNKLFKCSLSKKHIFVYGFQGISLFHNRMFDEVKKITSVDILNRESKVFEHSNIYEFDNLEDEVNFVCVKIIELLNKGIDINKIKIANVNQEYQNTLIKLFKFYNIPIYLRRNVSLYSTSIGKYFFEVLESNIGVTLEKILIKYKKYVEEYNLIVNIVNNYSWCDDFLSIRDMLVYDFKNTYIKEKKSDKQVECIELKDNIISDDLYVFLMNFNQGNIPVIHKDEDYITDVMKDEICCLERVVELNINEKRAMISSIRGVKNLIISFKRESSSGSYIISNLNDELGLEVISDFRDEYNYSNLYNRLRLASNIDKFVKYGVVEDSLSVLYHNYSDITYLTYKNQFTGIDKVKLENFLNHKLLLSYSTIDNYYRCGFRYYLSNILKLSIYEDTFMTTLGSLFHYVLERAFNKDDFNIEIEYQNYIDSCDKDFSIKEKFFLNKLKGELQFIIESIKMQMEYCTLDKALFEEKIYVDKSSDMNITFMGVVDKIIYGDVGDKCIVSIIDYKTGNPQININHTIYGIEMQLPVYLYLVKNSGKFSNVSIAGFYLQRVLNNEILRNYKNTYEQLKMNNLKLSGYSNEEVSILQHFDSGFNDSKVVKSLKTTNKGFYNYSKVIDDNKINKLVDIVDLKIDEAISNIRSACFDINPKRIGKFNYGCQFCKFKDICFMTENDIVNLKEYKNLEFLGGDDDDTCEA